MLKPKSAVCLAMAAALLMLCSCGQSADQKAYSDVMKQAQSSAAAGGEATRKLTVSSAGADDVTNTLKNHAEAYMKEHPDVSITVEVPGISADANTRLATQLMSGTAADVVEIVPTEKLLTSGHLVDLYGFMKNDPDFHEENYFMNVISAFETDGKLYGMCTNFIPRSLFAMRKDISPELTKTFETAEKLTFADIMNLYVKLAPEGKAAFYETFTPMDVLYYTFDKWVDLKNKTCDFNNKELRSLLEQAKKIPASGSKSSSNADSFTNLTEKTYPYVFMDCSVLPAEAEYLFPYEGKVFTLPRFISTPNGGNLFTGSKVLSITDTCADPELAWDFIKFCIAEKTESYSSVAQLGIGYSLTVGSFASVNKKNYARQCDAFLNTQYEFGRDAMIMELAESKEKAFADAKAFLMAIPGRLNVSDFPYQNPAEILWPEMQLYITDKQSLNVTLTNIQSKVQLYLNE